MAAWNQSRTLLPRLIQHWKIDLARLLQVNLYLTAATRHPQFRARRGPQACEVRRSGTGLVFSKPKRVYAHTKAKNPK